MKETLLALGNHLAGQPLLAAGTGMGIGILLILLTVTLVYALDPEEGPLFKYLATKFFSGREETAVVPVRTPADGLARWSEYDYYLSLRKLPRTTPPRLTLIKGGKRGN